MACPPSFLCHVPDPPGYPSKVTNPGFVHLRLRSEYSVSDSIVRIDDAIAAAAADQQPALALTDSANLFGWVKFYRAALARGVQPLCGNGTRVRLYGAVRPIRGCQNRPRFP